MCQNCFKRHHHLCTPFSPNLSAIRSNMTYKRCSMPIRESSLFCRPLAEPGFIAGRHSVGSRTFRQHPHLIGRHTINRSICTFTTGPVVAVMLLLLFSTQSSLLPSEPCDRQCFHACNWASSLTFNTPRANCPSFEGSTD